MRLYGLIGYPLTHSFSQKYFTDKFQREELNDCGYLNFPMEDIGELPVLIKSQKELKGLNVTIPHKQSVMQYLTDISEEAKAIGAVNVIKIIHRELPVNRYLLMGYNTDAYGFENTLKPFLKQHHKQALILGTGGASRAVSYVLKKLGIEVLFVSRQKVGKQLISYEQITEELMGSYSVIINTTPLGTFPDIADSPPIPYKYITAKHLLYDLVYNPEETLFLQRGKQQGATTNNGLKMLELQAEKAWEIWNK